MKTYFIKMITVLICVPLFGYASTLQSLHLESNATHLNVGDTVTLSVVGTYSDNSSKTLTSNIAYLITPSQSVRLSANILEVLKDGSVTVQASVDGVKSNTINIDIVWVVNAHTLPPEPDPAVNNATLAGVDSNNNGVRDDVERNIYATYPVRLQRELVMYSAIFFQEAIVRPLSEAQQTDKIGTKSLNCHVYLRGKNSEIQSDEFRPTRYLEDKTINTKERIRKYLDYNIALSGGVYGSGPKDWNREACSPEIISTLEEMGK